MPEAGRNRYVKDTGLPLGEKKEETKTRLPLVIVSSTHCSPVGCRQTGKIIHHTASAFLSCGRSDLGRAKQCHAAGRR